MTPILSNPSFLSLHSSYNLIEQSLQISLVASYILQSEKCALHKNFTYYAGIMLDAFAILLCYILYGKNVAT